MTVAQPPPSPDRATPPIEALSVSLEMDDPDALSENVRRIVPEVRFSATARRGFHSRIQGWGLGRSAVLSVRLDRGEARFPGRRDHVELTVPLHSGFEAGEGGRIREFGPGAAHTGAGGPFVIRPHLGSHVLGVSLDAAVFESHHEALDGRWGGRPRRVSPVSRMTTPAGRRLRDYLDRIWREIVQPDSPIHEPRVAREVEATLAQLLVEACFESASDDGRAAGDAATKRAEELFTAQLDRPVSLAEIAAVVGVSTRSLSRAFQQRHGMGPVAFQRRRRLEAGRRDLIDSEPGEATVSEVALRYGFIHLGRFAGDYRSTFGESPSETLRR